MSTTAITTAKEVFDLLRDELIAVEQEFERLSASEVDSITEIAGYLREGGGKRIRPALLLLAAKALGYNGNSSVRLGAVIEMIHTATLVHDDIIDWPIFAAVVPPQTLNGATPNVCWPATGCICRPSV